MGFDTFSLTPLAPKEIAETTASSQAPAWVILNRHFEKIRYQCMKV
jgi:hypothetical protein